MHTISPARGDSMGVDMHQIAEVLNTAYTIAKSLVGPLTLRAQHVKSTDLAPGRSADT